MTDNLSEAYAPLLEGTYDCPDRIVLNAYFRAGHIAGGFRAWWRRLHGSDEKLDNAHLMRMAGRFSRRLRAYAHKHGIPVIDCARGDRKHTIAAEYLPQDPQFVGLFAVLVSRASAPAWHVHKSDAGHILSLVRKYPCVNHYFFHIIDPDWGHVTIRMSGHPPFHAQVILNGHEYVARQAAANGVCFPKEGNCFTSTVASSETLASSDGFQSAVTLRADAESQHAVGPLEPIAGPSLKQVADTLCSESTVGQLRQVCDRWLYTTCLAFALSPEEQTQTGFRYDYSVFQVEVSRNLLFHKGQQLEQVFQGLIDRNRAHLDLQQVKTIFGTKRRPFWPRNKHRQPPREEIIVQRPTYDLTIFKLHFGPLTVKLYSKGACVLRAEAIVHNTKALKGKRSLSAFADIVCELRGILVRFLNQLQTLDSSCIAEDTLDTLPCPSQVGQSRMAGIDLNQPRMRAVMEAVVFLATMPHGFTASDLATKVREILNWNPGAYLPRHASYDLKKLRGKQWVRKVGRSRRYECVPEGLQTMTGLWVLREKLINPVLAGAGKPKRGPKPKHEKPIDSLYRVMHANMLALFQLLGVAV